jgi:signal transduction histidine kinase
MDILYISIILILLGIVLFQYGYIRSKNSSLRYIQSKLIDILNSGSSEQLLEFTKDKEIQNLLISINKLLTLNRKTDADYRHEEHSMRKMLSNISHDLKTPLTVVLGYLETIVQSDNMEDLEREQLISKVHNKTLEVIELINKFFDLAKLEAGDKNIPLSRINMNELCRKNILGFYQSLTQKGYEVELNIPDEKIYALGNEESINRILNNLISNGINYGGQGKFLGLNLRFDADFVFVDICDKGKGIDEIHKDSIFERMYTLEDSRNKDYQGSGLGLTITKRLVENLSGKINFKSKPFEKTVFTFSLKRVNF